jgi:hypothetical protein
MRVEFLRGEGEERSVVGVVRWADGAVTVDADDEHVRMALQRAFRRTPVVIDDPSYRRLGTHGEVVLQPSDLEWFRAVAQSRAVEETELSARFVPDVVKGGGYDPAAGYRTFEEQIERLDTGAGATVEG